MLKRQKRESEQGEEKAQGRKKLDSSPPFPPAFNYKLLTPTATGEGASVGEEEAVFSTAPPRTISKAQFLPRETNAGKKEECWERLGEVEGWTQETRIQMERTPLTCFLTFYFHFPLFSVPCVDSLPLTGLCRKQKRKKSKSGRLVFVRLHQLFYFWH